MEQVTNIIASFNIDESKKITAVISNNEILFFKQNGKNIDRKDLDLYDVFVLLFHDNDEDIPSFTLAEEGAVNEQDSFYIINKENKVIYVSKENEPCEYCRITGDSIILGCRKIESSDGLLIPQSTSGFLIKENELTDLAFAGKIAEHYLFTDKLGTYFLYEEMPNISLENRRFFCLKKKFNADFLFLWRVGYQTNVVLFRKTEPMHVHCYYDYDYNWQVHSLKTDVELSEYDWSKGIQILTDGNTLILHACNTGLLSGFTLVIENDEHHFKLLHQNSLCNNGRYADKIKLFKNSLILLQNSDGAIIFDKKGNVVARVTGSGYDYQRKRANITDYAIFSQRQTPYVKYGTAHDFFRYGVLDVGTLKVVVPPNFNEIDYIVLEEPSSKHYRVKGQYEIYIKVCMELLDGDGGYKKYWGLFKDSMYVEPCFYKSIELLRVKNRCFILLENHNGLKGIFYNGKAMTPCHYSAIEVDGDYLIMKKANGLFDVVYVDKDGATADAVLYKDFSSIIPASIKLCFQQYTYTSEDTIIVESGSKFGIISCGKVIAECVYDEICTINANPNEVLLGKGARNPIWFMVRSGALSGIYGIHGERLFKSAISYSDVEVLDYKTCEHGYKGDASRYMVAILDGEVYSLEDGTKICPDSDMEFVGFLSYNVLAFFNKKTLRLKLYDYRGRERAYEIFHSDGTLYDEEDLAQECIFEGSIALIKYLGNYKGEEYAFSFDEGEIIYNPFYQEDNEEYMDEDNENYSYDDYL